MGKNVGGNTIGDDKICLAIEADPRHLYSTVRAIDAFTRAACGQFEPLVEVIAPKTSWQKKHRIMLILKELLMPTLSDNESIALHLASEDARAAYEFGRTLEHVLWIENTKDDPNVDQWCVLKDPAMSVTSWGLPKMKIVTKEGE